MALARRAGTRALAEFTRILNIFTESTVHGRIPEEPVTATADRRPILKGGALISVVDDDESIRDSARTLLRSVGYEVATFASGELFLESGILLQTRCLILDIRMPGMSGLELQRRVNVESAVPIIFVTAQEDETNRKLAADAGAADFFQKPFLANDFLAAIQKAMNYSPDSLPAL